MRAIVLVLLMGGIATISAAQDPGGPALAGTWTATAAERDGAAAPDLVGHVLSFEGEDFTIVGTDGALIYAGTFAVDSAATPAAINFRNVSGLAAGQDWDGIYRLEGDALTIVDDAPDPAKGRPTAFAAPAGSGLVLLEFQRASGS